MLELLKIVVQPVLLERNADGQVIGEKTGEPIALYTPDQFTEYADAIRQQIHQANTNGFVPECR